MRVLLTVGLLAAFLAIFGCRPDDQPEGAETATADLWFRYQFVGTKAVAEDGNGTQLKRVAGFDQTVALARHVLDRLARSPGVLSDGALSPEQVEQGFVLLRPMLDDLVAYESFLDVRGPGQQQPEWLLGVALPAERAAAWRVGLRRLGEVWDLGDMAGGKGADNAKAGEFRRDGSPGIVRWAEAGGWLLIGIGDDTLAQFDRALAGILDTRRPVAAQHESWLVAEADLPRLAGQMEWAAWMNWPRAELKVAGQDENLRTTMRLLFPEPVTGPLHAWQVPTNTACEPLVSFTAMRGVAPLLERWDGLRALGLDPVPNELYLWAQEHTAFTTFGAFPAADPTNQIKRIVERAPGLLDESWHRQGWAQIEWEPASPQAIWKGLLIVTPHLRPVRDAGTNFVVGGLFRQLQTRRPPPAELLAQFVSQPDVVYYDWEITQVRLSQWRHLSQLFSVIAGQPQLATTMPALNWLLLLESEPLLGNCITEITAVSPREWSLVRRSHIGLNGLELVALARWFESGGFPRLDFRLREEATLKPARGVTLSPP